MADYVKIASDKDVMNSISMIVKPDLLTMYSSIYFIVCVPNEEGTISELEKIPFDSKLRVILSYVFTNPAESKAYIYIRVKSTTTARKINDRFRQLGIEETEIRVRLTGVKKAQLMQVMTGGFHFGKYPFPLRPYFREVRKEEKEFIELRDKKYREIRQRELVDEVRRSMGRKGKGSDPE